MIRSLLKTGFYKNNQLSFTSAKPFATTELPPINHTPKPHQGRSYEDVIRLRKQNQNPGIFHFYKEPQFITDGYMQYLWNHKGERFLDLFGGICTVSVGHCHPYVNEKIKEQVDKLQHCSTLYASEPSSVLAERIAATMPKGLDNFYFVNSGSEANELALLMASLYTNNSEFIALNNCYHGAGNTSHNLTSLKTWKYNVPRKIHVRHVTTPAQYRGPLGKDATIEAATTHAINDLKAALEFDSNGNVALFYTEPVYQGVGGIGSTRGDGTYHKRAYELIRSHGGLCLADEVQNGWARLGKTYWGFQQNEGCTPDIVTSAKSMGNGIPIAMVCTTKEIGEVMTRKLHFNTYGGNPISCTAAIAVMDVIENEGIQQKATDIGGYFKSELQRLADTYDVIGDIRGEGFMLGVEFVKNQDTHEPYPEYTAAFLEETLKESIMIGKGGLYGNIVRLQPPMCVTKADIEYTIYVFEKILKNMARP